MTIRFFFSLLVLAGVAVSEARPQQPVKSEVNGGETVEASDDIAKYTVGIGSEERATCTATIIAKDLLLTAAHCLPVTKIYFGVNTTSPQATKPVAKAMPHPKYVKGANKDRYDIALIYFTEGIPTGFEDIAFAGEGFRPKDGDKVIAAGFGVDLNDRTLGFLKKVELEVGFSAYSEMEMMLKQSEDDGVCSGDSGGPAFMKDSKGYVLVGVANAVANRKCGLFAIHALPNAHLDWLTQAAAEARSAKPEES